MRNYLLFFFALLTSSVVAQKFDIRRLELDGDKINLYYDLIDSVENHTYTVRVFVSKDNFISPLQKVSGAVGLEVAPGRNRKIVWDAKELGEGYDGNVALEVRGRLYIPFVRIEKLQKVLKRGVAYQVTWNGGTAQNILNFDLYRGEEKVTTFPNIANVGHTALIIPTHVKPGDDYRLQITDSRNRDQIVFTDVFRIKRRVPLGLKLGVVGILGGAGYYFASQSTGPSDIPEPGTPKK